MQRIIKFRFVYKHSETGEIKFHFCTLDELLEGPIEENRDHIAMDKLCHAGYDLISKDQYTGRKDKSDKELYERDVVILKILVEPFRGKGTYWVDQEFIVQFKAEGHHPERLEESEKIGSVYENPELLKAAE